MTLSWEFCRDAFEVDGSLRDIYVLGTDLGDWRRALDLLRESGLPIVYEVGGVQRAIPDDVAAMFATDPDDELGTLKIDLHGILIISHLFVDYEIEFDVDPREVQDDVALAHLLDFMHRIALRPDKPAILTPQNVQDIVLIEVAPNETQRRFPGR